MFENKTLRIGVVFDWENTVRTAGTVLPWGSDVRAATLDPHRLGWTLARRVESNLGPARLEQFTVVAGIASPFHNHRAWRQRDLEARQWRARKGGQAHLVELENRPGGGWRESAEVDELVRESIMSMARSGAVDVLVAFTNDREVGSAAHDAFRFTPTRVNTAVWSDLPSAVYRPGMYVHHLGFDDYRRCSTPSNWAA